MRQSRVISLLLTIIVAALLPAIPAAAGGFEKSDTPAGWGRERTVRHWVYYPRYAHAFHTSSVTDPYAYRYEPRGYYPYYNSGYWRPRHLVAKNRAHFRHPTYYKAWGAKRKWYHHYRWHAKNHGRIEHGHW